MLAATAGPAAPHRPGLWAATAAMPLLGYTHNGQAVPTNPLAAALQPTDTGARSGP